MPNWLAIHRRDGFVWVQFPGRRPWPAVLPGLSRDPPAICPLHPLLPGSRLHPGVPLCSSGEPYFAAQCKACQPCPSLNVTNAPASRSVAMVSGVPNAEAKWEGRSAVFAPRLRIRANVEQECDIPWNVSACHLVQRSFALLVACVRIRAQVNQCGDVFRRSMACRFVYRCVGGSICGIHLCTGLNQGGKMLRRPHACCPVNWCLSVFVRGIHLRTSLKKRGDHRGHAEPRSRVQRCLAIPIVHIDGCTCVGAVPGGARHRILRPCPEVYLHPRFRSQG